MNHLKPFNESSYNTVEPEVKNILDTVTDEGIEMKVQRDYIRGNYPNGSGEVYYLVSFMNNGVTTPRNFYQICKNAYDRLKHSGYLKERSISAYSGKNRDGETKPSFGIIYSTTRSKDHPDGFCHIEGFEDFPYHTPISFILYVNKNANVSESVNESSNIEIDHVINMLRDEDYKVENYDYRPFINKKKFVISSNKNHSWYSGNSSLIPIYNVKDFIDIISNAKDRLETIIDISCDITVRAFDGSYQDIDIGKLRNLRWDNENPRRRSQRNPFRYILKATIEIKE